MSGFEAGCSLGICPVEVADSAIEAAMHMFSLTRLVCPQRKATSGRPTAAQGVGVASGVGEGVWSGPGVAVSSRSLAMLMMRSGGWGVGVVPAAETSPSSDATP